MMPLISTFPSPAMLATRLVIGDTVETTRTFRPVTTFAEMHWSAAAFDCESSTVGSICSSAVGTELSDEPESDELEQAVSTRPDIRAILMIFFKRTDIEANWIFSPMEWFTED